jgi:hypothetical protein
MSSEPEDTDDEIYICLDWFPDNTTILIAKPGDKKLFVYSEWECWLERVTLEGYIAYRNMRIKRVNSE